MENEYQVLSHLQDNESTTQRGIAKRTGLSLGAVNILLKKMAKKGLVKIERLNSRTMRYILTPRGMQEKTRLTYQFIKSSYRQILNITQAVEDHLTAITAEEKHPRVVLYGPADEIEAILKNTLQKMEITPTIKRPAEDAFIPAADQHILTWRSEDEENLPADSRVVNVMRLV